MKNQDFIWANLVHLGSNMWNEEGNTTGREHRSTPCASPKFLFHRAEWNAHMQELKDAGVNMLVLDLGEALRYASHPELGAEGAWSHEEMKQELMRLQKMGFEVIPKLNFSACHDVWLKDYSRMLSTPIYYEVCRDLIRDVCSIFKPRFFHLGMDEETAAHQVRLQYAVIRQGDLWWKDFYFLVDCVEKEGARPWIWSDYIWSNPETFLEKMPKDVLQSNWYYSTQLDVNDPTLKPYNIPRIESFDLLEKHGYDQIPTGSAFGKTPNFRELTEFCQSHISPEHLKGMMQTTWERIDPDWMAIHHLAADHIKEAKQKFESRS